MKLAAVLVPVLLVGLAMPAAAQRFRDQDAAYQGRKSGALLPLRAIEGAVVPRMQARGADYIGSEFDSDVGRYRLKFVRNGAVIWVDVDGRTGAIVGRTGD